jgi:hypothetical protein
MHSPEASWHLHRRYRSELASSSGELPSERRLVAQLLSRWWQSKSYPPALVQLLGKRPVHLSHLKVIVSAVGSDEVKSFVLHPVRCCRVDGSVLCRDEEIGRASLKRCVGVPVGPLAAHDGLRGCGPIAQDDDHVRRRCVPIRSIRGVRIVGPADVSGPEPTIAKAVVAKAAPVSEAYAEAVPVSSPAVQAGAKARKAAMTRASDEPAVTKGTV